MHSPLLLTAWTSNTRQGTHGRRCCCCTACRPLSYRLVLANQPPPNSMASAGPCSRGLRHPAQAGTRRAAHAVCPYRHHYQRSCRQHRQPGASLLVVLDSAPRWHTRGPVNPSPPGTLNNNTPPLDAFPPVQDSAPPPSWHRRLRSRGSRAAQRSRPRPRPRPPALEMGRWATWQCVSGVGGWSWPSWLG